jgi:hypothetical protein
VCVCVCVCVAYAGRPTNNIHKREREQGRKQERFSRAAGDRLLEYVAPLLTWNMGAQYACIFTCGVVIGREQGWGKRKRSEIFQCRYAALQEQAEGFCM